MEKYKVNTGPLPESAMQKKASPYHFDKMNIGEWFVVDGVAKAESAQNAAYYYGKKNGVPFKLSRRRDTRFPECYYMMRVE
jgi:hypothetical protein